MYAVGKRLRMNGEDSATALLTVIDTGSPACIKLQIPHIIQPEPDIVNLLVVYIQHYGSFFVIPVRQSFLQQVCTLSRRCFQTDLPGIPNRSVKGDIAEFRFYRQWFRGIIDTL